MGGRVTESCVGAGKTIYIQLTDEGLAFSCYVPPSEIKRFTTLTPNNLNTIKYNKQYKMSGNVRRSVQKKE
jgi:hypothetical protein